MESSELGAIDLSRNLMHDSAESRCAAAAMSAVIGCTNPLSLPAMDAKDLRRRAATVIRPLDV